MPPKQVIVCTPALQSIFFAAQRLREKHGGLSLDELSTRPITRKDSLSKMQAENPPFAGLLAGPPTRLRRMFASPGPTYVPQGMAVDYWRFGMAFTACGPDKSPTTGMTIS